MPRRTMPRRFEATPGQIYGGITSIGNDFSGSSNDGTMLVEKNNSFVTYCRQMGKKYPSFRKGAKFSKKHQKAVSFLNWRLSPGDFMAAIKGTFVTYFFPALIILAIVYTFGIGIEIGSFSTSNLMGEPFLLQMVGTDAQSAMMLFGVIAVVLFGAIGAGVYGIYSTPINAANDEKNKALTYVPEMIGYMIMSMKLVPNLEKSIEFSAKHGRGRIATEFKKLLWDFQIGVFESVSIGLDDLAYRWADYSSELKESLMKVRASVKPICDKSKVIRRRGVVRIICENKKHKQRQK